MKLGLNTSSILMIRGQGRGEKTDARRMPEKKWCWLNKINTELDPGCLYFMTLIAMVTNDSKIIGLWRFL